MAKTEKQGGGASGTRDRVGRSGGVSRNAPAARFVSLQAARRAGLLDSEGSEHLSFRAPKALVEAARRESGLTSTTELGIVALSMLAEPDPVIAFMKRTRGVLGEDAGLDY